MTLLLGGSALAACGDDPAAEAGEVFAADRDVVQSRAFDVRLPTGSLQVRIRNAAQTVSADDTADGSELAAVDGVAYLGIGWDVSASDGRPDAVQPGAADLLSGVAERPSLVLVGRDGARFDVGTGGASEGVFVAVPEGLRESGHLEVGFDGVVQQVSLDDYEVDPGDAVALYDDPRADREELHCSGTTSAPDVALGQTCGALLVEVPWAPEAGWAPPGTTWAAIRLEARLDVVDVGKGAGAASYTVTGAEVTATLAGDRPAATLAKPATGPGDTNAWLVFPMPAEPADLVVSGTYAAERTSGSPARPDTRDFTTTATVGIAP